MSLRHILLVYQKASIIALLWVTCISSAHSAPRPDETVNSQGAFPTLETFYPADDPLRLFKLDAEQIMGLYLVEPPRRHVSEKTEWYDGHLHFHIWRPIGEWTEQQLWSQAAGWLIFGRHRYAKGAQELFSLVEELDRVSLSFKEVIRPDQKGRRKSKRSDKIYVYLTISITRKNFERLNILEVRDCARNLDCDSSIRRMFSIMKLNQKYLKSVRK